MGNYTCAVNKIALGSFPSESIIERKTNIELGKIIDSKIAML